MLQEFDITMINFVSFCKTLWKNLEKIDRLLMCNLVDDTHSENQSV